MFRHSLSPVHGRNRVPKVFWGVGLMMCACFFVLMPTSSTTVHAVSINNAAPAAAASKATAASSNQVQVTLYVMSQCPDAKFCAKAFKPVLETLPTVASVRTEYIATLAAEEDDVQCMHGAAECDGNKHQLCLQHHLPAADNRKYFQALLCHSKGRVNDVQHLQGCMTEVGVDGSVQAEVLKCIDSTLGTSLQVASAKQVKANSVVKSCTVFIDGVKRCIRDGGRWYDCPGGFETQDFINSICDAHRTKAGKAAPECEAAVGAAAAAA